jgi:hypothetical protein
MMQIAPKHVGVLILYICVTMTCTCLTIKIQYRSPLSLTSMLDGVGGQCHSPATLPAGRRPSTDCTRGWVGPITQLHGCKNLAPIRIRSSDHPACSESLYQVDYPAHIITKKVFKQIYLHTVSIQGISTIFTDQMPNFHIFKNVLFVPSSKFSTVITCNLTSLRNEKV